MKSLDFSIERKPEWEQDYLLARQAVQGDDGAWQALYDSAYPAVLRHVQQKFRQSMPQEESEEEIVNEAFRRCYHRLSTFEGRSLFSTWVCAYARYVLLQNQQQALRHQRGRLLAEQEWYGSRSIAQPEDITIQHQRDQCLWIAFYSLSKDHQLLILCHVLKELRTADVAKETGLHYKKQKQELPQALSILKRRFIALYYNNFFQ